MYLGPFTNKKDFLAPWVEGRIGNRPAIWPTLEEALASGFDREIAIRYCGHFAGGPFITNLRRHELTGALDTLLRQGYLPKDFYFIEQVTNTNNTYLMNGEITRIAPDGLWLFYSEENKLMRDALRSSGRSIYGLRSLLMLRRILWPDELDYLLSLVDTFFDHAIEFSVVRKPVGIWPSRLIIWEIRTGF